MKPKTNAEEYNKQLDILAQEAMKCILNGAYSHPVILAQLGEIADQNKLSMVQEIAERSYVMAATMLKWKHKFIMKNEESSASIKK